MATPTLFIDDVAQTALEARFPARTGKPVPIYDTGMTMGASNSPGIGISDDNPDLQESLFAATDGSGDLVVGSWTLLDQHENARAAQIGQLIGGDGIMINANYPSSGGVEGTAPDAVIRFGANPDNVNGQPDNDAVIVPGAGADLAVLADGWADVV
jgi:hypothetical protein